MSIPIILSLLTIRFSVTNAKVNDLLKMLNNRVYNGREIDVEVAMGKKSSSKKNKDEGDKPRSRKSSSEKPKKEEQSPKKDNAKTRGTK